MIPLLPAIVAGSSILTIYKYSKNKKANRSQVFTKPTAQKKFFRQTLSQWDERYQNFIQTNLDTKIIGEVRQQQLLEINGGKSRELSNQEKQINRKLLLGAGALGLLGFSYISGLTVYPLILAIGLFNFTPLIKETWRVATKERRFSLLHLLLGYFGYMWWSGSYLIGTIGLLLFNLNRKVLLISETVTRNSLVQLLGEQPQKVFILLNDIEIEILFTDLQIGDTLILQAGQQVPIDGTILQGAATVDQHRLTGESQPVEKAVGDNLFASTTILSGRIQVRVEKTGAETTAAKISSILQKTVEIQQTSIADQFRFLESTKWVMLAGSGLGWWLFNPTTALALLGCNFLTSMIPLKLITLLNTLKTSAEHGVLIKDGRIMEKLPQITSIVFDKTGTLTLSQPQVSYIYCEDGYTEKEILTLAATAEQRQTHPIALAILSAAKQQHLELYPLKDAEYQLGLGLTVWITDKLIHVGSERFFEEETIVLSDSLQQQRDIAEKEGESLIFIAVNNQAIGAIRLSASLRPEAQEMIHWFKQQGLSTYILSGDQEAPTRKLAQQLRVDNYFANTLPEQKAERIKELQTQGHKVCFIGDGINDAIALLQAEVSISLQGATTVATDSAKIILMNNDLMQLTLLWEVANNYRNNISHNQNRARQFSFVAATGVCLLPFKFWIVESMWASQVAIGLSIANKPMLTTDQTENTRKKLVANLS